MSESVSIDMFADDFKANPYPDYAMLRLHDPIHRINLTGERGAWLVTRFEDADAVLKDQRFVKSTRTLFPPDQAFLEKYPLYSVMEQINSHMLASDPPDHTRLRALVNKAFTPAMIEQWRERIQAIADELLDAVQDKGEMELINDYAFPLPMAVISEMLGVPYEDRLKFRDWSNTLITSIGDPEGFMQILPKMANFVAYLLNFIAIRRVQPTDDLVSRLVAAESEGDKLSENELVSTIFLLLVAGHETTVNLIGNGMLALLRHPEQKATLQQHPELIKTAIEELLRYNGPLFNATSRWAREDVEIGGVKIQRGDMVMVGLSSANHDEQQFAHAEELDITRQENRHLAFGKGIHYCLGAPLARLEGQIAITTLLKRMPAVQLAVEPETLKWRPGTLIHALETLPVKF